MKNACHFDLKHLSEMYVIFNYRNETKSLQQQHWIHIVVLKYTHMWNKGYTTGFRYRRRRGSPTNRKSDEKKSVSIVNLTPILPALRSSERGQNWRDLRLIPTFLSLFRFEGEPLLFLYQNPVGYTWEQLHKFCDLTDIALVLDHDRSRGLSSTNVWNVGIQGSGKNLHPRPNFWVCFTATLTFEDMT